MTGYLAFAGVREPRFTAPSEDLPMQDIEYAGPAIVLVDSPEMRELSSHCK